MAQGDFDRRGKAEFFLLQEARRAKFMGEKAIPIVDAIDKVDVPDIVKDILKRILTPAGIGQVAE